MKPDEMLTPTEVAAMLKVDVETIRRMVRRRQIPAYQIGRMLRIAEHDVRAFLSRCRTHVTPEHQKQAKNRHCVSLRTETQGGSKA